MRAAAIDIGTNSVKLVVGETEDGTIRLVLDSAVITGLGCGVGAAGAIQPEGARKTLAAISQLAHSARRMGACEIRAVATSALRDAANGGDFVKQAEQEAGIALEVLSGEEEARLCRLAVSMDPTFSGCDGGIVTIDIGGGSTEVTFPEGAISVDLGAVRLHEGFIGSDPPAPSEVAAASRSAVQLLGQIEPLSNGARLFGTGGTVINAARILRRAEIKDAALVHGEILNKREVSSLVSRLARTALGERRSIIGLDPERADIILAGTVILQAAMDSLDAEEITVSTHGLRHGVLYEMLGVKQ